MTYPTDTLISGSANAIMLDFLLDIEIYDNEKDLQNFVYESEYTKNLSNVLIYKLWCKIHDQPEDTNEYRCVSCNTLHHRSYIYERQISNSEHTHELCASCYNFSIKLKKEVEQFYSSYICVSLKCKASKHTNQCPICFNEKECYEFFECKHSCCFDCYTQLAPCKCWFRCDD